MFRALGVRVKATTTKSMINYSENNNYNESEKTCNQKQQQNQTLVLVKRSCGEDIKDSKTRKLLYYSLLRPPLECCSNVSSFTPSNTAVWLKMLSVVLQNSFLLNHPSTNVQRAKHSDFCLFNADAICQIFCSCSTIEPKLSMPSLINISRRVPYFTTIEIVI